MTAPETYQQVLAGRPELLPYHKFLLDQAVADPNLLAPKNRLTGFIFALLVSHGTQFDDPLAAKEVAEALIRQALLNEYTVTHLIYPDPQGQVVSTKIFMARDAEDAAMQAAEGVYASTVPLDNLALVARSFNDKHHASFEVGVLSDFGFFGFKNYFGVARVEASATS